MRHRAEPASFRLRERSRVELGRVVAFRAAQADPDDAAAGVGERVPDGQVGGLRRVAAHDVRGERDPHAVPLKRLRGAVAVAGEDFFPGHAARGGLGRGEDALQVDRAMRGCLGRVVDHDLPEVPFGSQRAGRHPPHVEEVREVAELVDRGQLPGRAGGQRDAIAAGDLEQGGRTDGALEMDVQLDLRVGHAHILASRLRRPEPGATERGRKGAGGAADRHQLGAARKGPGSSRKPKARPRIGNYLLSFRPARNRLPGRRVRGA